MAKTTWYCFFFEQLIVICCFAAFLNDKWIEGTSLCMNGSLSDIMSPVVSDATANVVSKINVTENGSLPDQKFDYSMSIDSLTFSQVKNSVFKSYANYSAKANAYVVVKLSFKLSLNNVHYIEKDTTKTANYDLKIDLEIIASVEVEFSSNVQYVVTGIGESKKNSTSYKLKDPLPPPVAVTVSLRAHKKKPKSHSMDDTGLGLKFTSDGYSPKCKESTVCIATGL